MARYEVGDWVRIKTPPTYMPRSSSAECKWLAKVDTVQQIMVAAIKNHHEANDIYTFNFPEALRVFGRELRLGHSWLSPVDPDTWCTCELCEMRRRDG